MKIQIAFRRNPETVGWARRAAIALLVGFGTLLVSIPFSFFFFLSHYNRVYPNDPQNMLSALTAGMLVGLGLAAITATASVVVSLFFGLSKPVSDVSA